MESFQPLKISDISMRSLAKLALLTLGFVVCPWISAETNRPLQTEPWECLQAGEIQLSLGADYRETPLVPFHSHEGSMLSVPVIALRLGASEDIEFQIEGAGQIWANPDEGGNESDFGDFSLWMKWAFFQPDSAPKLGFRWGVKLPNTGDETGLGSDSTDFYGHIIASRDFSRGRVYTNLGVGIIQRATEVRQQDDVFTYALAAEGQIKEHIFVLGEVEGHTAAGSLRAQSVARLGIRCHRNRWTWDAAVLAGLTEWSADWGVTTGGSYRWKGWS